MMNRITPRTDLGRMPKSVCEPLRKSASRRSWRIGMPPPDAPKPVGRGGDKYAT